MKLINSATKSQRFTKNEIQHILINKAYFFKNLIFKHLFNFDRKPITHNPKPYLHLYSHETNRPKPLKGM